MTPTRSRPRRGLGWVLLLAAIGTGGPSLAAAVDQERARALQLVVQLTGQNDYGDRKFGAGIVFAVRRDSVLVATSNHVVRPENAAMNVRVRFKPGTDEAEPENRDLPAVVLPDFDADLDLAVVEVGLESGGFVSDLVPDPTATQVPPQGLDQDSWVFPVGHPYTRPWDVSDQPRPVMPASEGQVEFFYSCMPGHSGGGLFDTRWRLAGLLRASRATGCTAIAIETVRSRLESWGYCVDFAQPQPACPVPEPCGSTTPQTWLGKRGTLRWHERYLDGLGRFRTCVNQGDACDLGGMIDEMQHLACDASVGVDAGFCREVDKVPLPGAFSEPGVPYYYLGLAWYRCGDYLRAAESWRRSRDRVSVSQDRSRDGKCRIKGLKRSPRRWKALSDLIEFSEARDEIRRCLERGVQVDQRETAAIDERVATVIAREEEAILKTLRPSRRDLKKLSAAAEEASSLSEAYLCRRSGR